MKEPTEIIIDLVGPIVDITKLPVFRDLPDVRYLHESEIVRVMQARGVSFDMMHRTSGVISEEELLENTILKIVANTLQGKSRWTILDEEVMELLVKANTFGANIVIISSTKDGELFSKAEEAVRSYSKYLCNRLIEEDRGSPKSVFTPLTERTEFFRYVSERKQKEGYDFRAKCGQNGANEDGYNYESLDALLLARNAEAGNRQCFRIMFDDAFDTTGVSNIELINEWIGGLSHGEEINRLDRIIKERWQLSKVEDDCNTLLQSGNEISLSKYDIDVARVLDDTISYKTKIFGFYVFDEEIREKLKQDVECIDRIISLSSEDDRQRPVCVFLAGDPGAGKSYFVERFANFFDADEKYPTISLSGVPSEEFSNAIRHHIETVYDRRTNEIGQTRVAFLDEVDTRGGGDNLAFRLLMDAMTGSATDDRGVRRAERTKSLVWFFAGSSGPDREGFKSVFRDKCPKVVDFFDRIHLDLVLPSVSSPGQAIVTFLSFLRPKQPSKQPHIHVNKNVLRLFGQTVWRSTRQIQTISRIACARCSDQDDVNRIDITLDWFDGIDISREFAKSFENIRNMIEGGCLQSGEKIIVKW